MPNVERDVVKTSSLPANMGDKRNNGFLPLGGGPSATHPANEAYKGGDRRGGSADLTGLASPVHTPDHRFNIGNAKMPQPPAAFEPGKGAVPVYPFIPGGQGINRVEPEADTAKAFKTENWPPR
jgi:hypothetical protein